MHAHTVVHTVVSNIIHIFLTSTTTTHANLTHQMLSPSTTSIAVNATASLLQKNVPNVAFSSGGGGGGGGSVHAQLTPLIPGVSVPWSHTWYLVFALLFNGVFHELGTMMPTL